MKTKLLLSLLAILFISTNLFGQGFTKPDEGKSVIYIMQTATGFNTTFIFDGEYFVGKCKGRSYIRYECEPGNYTFLALSGVNKGFLTAELEANRIYITSIRTVANIPVFKDVDKNKAKFTNRILTLANSEAPFVKDEALKTKMEKRWKKFTQKAYSKFETKQKAKNKHLVITKDMFYQK